MFAYEAASDEGGYVMGKMAAALTTSSTRWIVGPVEVGDAKLYVDGFKNGAEADGSGVTVNINYTGSFSDVQLASEAASAHIAAGADVLTGTAQMVVGAISVADEAGVPWFGTQANQSSLARHRGCQPGVQVGGRAARHPRPDGRRGLGGPPT